VKERRGGELCERTHIVAALDVLALELVHRDAGHHHSADPAAGEGSRELGATASDAQRTRERTYTFMTSPKTGLSMLATSRTFSLYTETFERMAATSKELRVSAHREGRGRERGRTHRVDCETVSRDESAVARQLGQAELDVPV